MALLALVLSPIIPVLTLVVFLVRKGQSRFIAFHSLQALFLTLCLVAAMIVVSVAAAMTLEVVVLLYPLLWIGALVMAIKWGRKANRAEWAELPVIGAWAKRWA